jgi:hypothetical protein
MRAYDPSRGQIDDAERRVEIDPEALCSHNGWNRQRADVNRDLGTHA